MTVAVAKQWVGPAFFIAKISVKLNPVRCTLKIRQGEDINMA
jgi:hypothetical protein